MPKVRELRQRGKEWDSHDRTTPVLRLADLDQERFVVGSLAVEWVPARVLSLATLRKENKITQQELAVAAEVSIKTVQRLENYQRYREDSKGNVVVLPVSAGTEAKIRAALMALIREKAPFVPEATPPGYSQSFAGEIPKAYKGNIAFLERIARKIASGIVAKEVAIRRSFTTLFQEDIDDIAQGGLLHLLSRAHEYDPEWGRKNGRRQAKFTTWAYSPIRTGCNTQADRLRNQRGRLTTGRQIATFLPLKDELLDDLPEDQPRNPKRKQKGHGPDLLEKPERTGEC